MDDENGERRGRVRGRPRGRQRGRQRSSGKALRSCKKNKIDSDDEEPEPEPEQEQKTFEAEENQPPPYDKDCDISALEAPTFTTLNRAPSGPMMSLSWNHPVNLIGEKVLSPRIHVCDTCSKPILIYGRMIPCKHVFCLTCAKSEDRVCSRCGERVARVEQTGLGTVFMCTFSVGDALCKRTYLSQRDLQAHIDHRHIKMSKEENKNTISHRECRPGDLPVVRPPLEQQRQNVPSMILPRGDIRPNSVVNDPRVSTGVKNELHEREFNANVTQYVQRGFVQGQQMLPAATLPGGICIGGVTTQSLGMGRPLSHHPIPVMTSSRSNLITVPIQEPHEPPQYAPITQPPHQIPGSIHSQPVQVGQHPPSANRNPHQIQHQSHPFTSPPPLNPHGHLPPYSSPYSVASGQPQQQGPHITHSPAIPPPQPQPPTSFAVNRPPIPVPVPPPSTQYANRLPYEGAYGSRQWGAMPPIQQGPGHPSRHPIMPPNQPGNYYG